jgi:heme a synthase
MAVAEYPIGVSPDVQTTAGVRAASAGVAAVAPMRLYFLVLAAASLIAFVFGVENRLTSDGLFNLPPDVDWLPPLTAQDWFAAFTRHQQDPVFAACGGTESLAEFKTLYWWEWGRQASALAVAGIAAAGLLWASISRDFGSALPGLIGLVAAALVFWVARGFIDMAVADVEILSRYNVGQYRQAADATFASALVASVVAFAVVRPRPIVRMRAGAPSRSEWLWFTFIALDICFGALFAARGATPVWTTWPGYDGSLLPPLERLFSYTPVWLNFTFNQYMIQLVHRTLSAGLFIAAVWSLVLAIRSSVAVHLAATRLLLLTVQMLTGIATLMLDVPAALSLAHQIGSIFLLACPLSVLLADRNLGSAARSVRAG